jgi:predicted lysophospholipase L1 biosynthesis ABC-type transport system permease subunit
MRRVRELGLRTALGAGRVRLFRQLATESLIVAAAGGVLGLGLAYATQSLLVEFVGRFTPRTGQIGIDGSVLLFALAVSIVTGLAFGARPAMAAESGLLVALREGHRAGRREPGSGSACARASWVAQVAVSFVLLVGAGLMIQSLYRIASVPLGYHGENVTTAAYFGNFSRMNTAAEAHRVQARILETLRSTPGVRAAALTNAVPQASVTPGQVIVTVEGRRPRTACGSKPIPTSPATATSTCSK